MAIQLSPFFGQQRQPAPFQPAMAAQPQQGADPRLLLGLGGFARGFLEGGQRGGLGAALLGGAAGGLPGIARGQFIQQQQAQQQVEAEQAARQQAVQNAMAQQEAQRKAAADARGVLEFDKTFGLRQEGEQRQAQSAAAQQAIARGNLAVGQGNLALRGKEFERGRVDPLVEVFDPGSPTGSTFVPRSEAAGQASVGSFAGSGLTPGKAEDLGAQAEGIQGAVSSLDRIIADIRANPQRAGGVGAINKFLQTGFGIGRDIVDLVPGVSTVTEAIFGPAISQESDDVRDFLSDQSIERNQTGANSIAYALAARRKAGTGSKVTVKDIDLAFDDLQLTGLKSTAQKIAQLEELRREFVEGEALLRQRVAAGTPGAAQIQAPSAASATQADLGTMSIEQLMQLRAGVAGNP